MGSPDTARLSPKFKMTVWTEAIASADAMSCTASEKCFQHSWTGSLNLSCAQTYYMLSPTQLSKAYSYPMQASNPGLLMASAPCNPRLGGHIMDKSVLYNEFSGTVKDFARSVVPLM